MKRGQIDRLQKTEEGLKTTPCSECALNALAIDEPFEYASEFVQDTHCLTDIIKRFNPASNMISS